MSNRLRLIHVSIYLGMVGLLGCQTAWAEVLPPIIEQKILEANLSKDSVSMVVQPLGKQGEQGAFLPKLIDYQADIPRTPASTQKLIPTFIALDSLGKDFVWQTKLYQDGMLWQGTLYGDVIVQGSGDPKLDSAKVYQLLSMVKSHGIERITGDLIINNRQFRGVDFDINAFDGRGYRPYNAQPNALLTDFGTLKVELNPVAKPTAIPATTASTTPTASPATEANEPSVMPEGEDAGTANQPTIKPNDIDHFTVTVTPKLANYNAPTELALSQAPCQAGADKWIAEVTPTQLQFSEMPSVHCGRQQRWLSFPNGDNMVKDMITADWQQIMPQFTGKIRFADTADLPPAKVNIPEAMPWYLRWYLKLTAKPTAPKLIGYVASNPLSEQIKDINQHSNNVMTEQIALSLPLYIEGKKDIEGKKLANQNADSQNLDSQLTTPKGVSDYPKTFAVMNTWWQQHLPNATAPVMSRASGLCRDCQVKPNSLLALLNFAYRSPNFDTYRNSMGVAGESGTIKALKWRQPNNPAIGRAWIKTGTLDNVTSMAGYIQGQSGQWYAVVGMINADNVKNNSQAKAVLDEMLAWTAVK
ncbi:MULTISPECIES: D-alanyl-D-alanine carboxypeptidase/D-alanyl-D-alanine-endopeptidase [unclassified Moraxella]|uniref:D-alanyl-D-alanine carboxypeptidase/D-alanyl-D-alanine-endopeptidase n=1 Tax=unclassified Moraxella TaxID=2685852 RepID=UPI003AF6A1AC